MMEDFNKIKEDYIQTAIEVGWVLKKDEDGVLSFTSSPCQPIPPTSQVEPEKSYEQTKQDYIKACKDIGWEFIEDRDGSLSFKSGINNNYDPVRALANFVQQQRQLNKSDQPKGA